MENGIGGKVFLPYCYLFKNNVMLLVLISSWSSAFPIYHKQFLLRRALHLQLLIARHVIAL
jgi:hypothetical protein